MTDERASPTKEFAPVLTPRAKASDESRAFSAVRVARLPDAMAAASAVSAKP